MILGACAAEEPTGVIPPEAPVFSETQVPPSCSGRGDSTHTSFTNFFRYWNCGKVIRVAGDIGIISPAIDAWNSALLPDSFPNLPRFEYWSGTGPDMTVVIESGSGGYCGRTEVPDKRTVTLMRESSGQCLTNWSDAATTLTHELGHVLGYQAGAHQTPPEYCTMRLPDPPDHSINSIVCQHEVEGVLSAYSFRADLDDTPTFWTTPIVTGLTTNPTAVTVAKDSTVQVLVTHFRFDRQNGAQPVAVGSATFSWGSKNQNTALVSSSGLVTGVGAGTTQVQIASATNFPSSYQKGARFGGWGHEIPVTVTAPPPPPPGAFKVVDIVGLTPPATEAGTYSLTATVSNPPEGTLKIRWEVTFSNGVLGPFDTGYVPNSYALQVPAGSYSIRVTATPRSYQGTSYAQGYAMIRDFTVCTGGGGGGEYLVYETGGEGPDAVGGC